jgi:hypothetical protein
MDGGLETGGDRGQTGLLPGAEDAAYDSHCIQQDAGLQQSTEIAEIEE